MEPVRRYSHSETLVDLRKVTEVIATDRKTATDEPNPMSRQPAQVWALTDRLPRESWVKIVEEWRAGTTQNELAKRYGISQSSIKRIIRESKAKPA